MSYVNMIRRAIKNLIHNDTEADKKRYDIIYDNLRGLDKNQLSNLLGLQTVDLFQRPLFIKYYSEIQKMLINTELVVMELGAGFGRHTSVIADCGVKLIVSDISESALEINNRIHPNIYKSIWMPSHFQTNQLMLSSVAAASVMQTLKKLTEKFLGF